MKRVAVIVLALFATFQAAAQEPPFTLRVDVDLVNVLFTVKDRQGRLVPGLTADDFIVRENGEVQDITRFTSENELPLTLAMVIDTSLSVSPVFERQKVTAAAFLREVLRPTDLALVIGFDRTAVLVQDFTENPERLTAALDRLRIAPGTSLYDAVYLAAKGKLAHEAGRRAIILLSDGDDSTSRLRLGDALMAVHNADAVVYSVFNLPDRSRNGNTGDQRTLRTLAQETGGAMYSIRGSNFANVFSQISNELRSQYTLAYRSTNTVMDGRYRRLEITPKDSALTVQARRGYYAPYAPDNP